MENGEGKYVYILLVEDNPGDVELVKEGRRRKSESSVPAFQPPAPIFHPFKVAWLSLDEGDNDLTRFLTYFVAAWQTIAPTVGKATLEALQSSQRRPAKCC